MISISHALYLVTTSRKQHGLNVFDVRPVPHPGVAGFIVPVPNINLVDPRKFVS